MSISDWINVILCVLSFILAMISVVTVVVTLKQNKQMIQNSTRPYVVATSQVTNFSTPQFYLIVKNYGNSGARIIKFSSSISLGDVSYSDKHIPFNSFEGTFIAPQQSFVCNLDYKKMNAKNMSEFTINLEYTDGINNFKESYKINYAVYGDNLTVRASTNDKELHTISYTLQDLVEKNF